LCLWALCSCGPYVLVGLMYLRALCACGPYVLVGFMCLWALCSCGPYVLAGLMYLRALCACGPYVLVGFMCLWALCSCGPYVLAGLMYLQDLCACGPYVLAGLMYLRALCACGPLCFAYTSYMVAIKQKCFVPRRQLWRIAMNEWSRNLEGCDTVPQHRINLITLDDVWGVLLDKYSRWSVQQFLGAFTYLLTPWSRVLLEKLTVNFAASQEIPRIYGTRKFLTVPQEPAIGAFTRLRKATIRFAMSVRPHGKTWLPLDGFSWNFIFQCFSKICRENSSYNNIRQE
jgi:hypothetical protein